MGKAWAEVTGLTVHTVLSSFRTAQRIFYTELMASYVAHSLALSPVTLALLQDSGWCGRT